MFLLRNEPFGGHACHSSGVLLCFFSARKRLHERLAEHDDPADITARCHLFALTAPGWLFRHHHRTSNNHRRRGAMPPLSSALSPASRALCANGCCSPLDGLRRTSATPYPSLFLSQRGMCSPDFHRTAAKRRGSLRPAYHATHRCLYSYRLRGSRGEAGKRLVAGMGLVTSPDTLLRLIHTATEQPVSTPRVLGVDDLAFRQRRTYATILIVLEERVPMDLLPDREAETLKKWLKAHRGIEIMSRDRGGAYADGARQGAPEAQQVADRWHLLSNLSEGMKSFFLEPRKHGSTPWGTRHQKTFLSRRLPNSLPATPE
jgi:Transposase